MITLDKMKTYVYVLVPHAGFCVSMCGFPRPSVFIYPVSSEQARLYKAMNWAVVNWPSVRREKPTAPISLSAPYLHQ